MTLFTLQVSAAQTAELCKKLDSAKRTIATQNVLLRAASVFQAQRKKDMARLQRTFLALEQEADQKMRSMAEQAEQGEALKIEKNKLLGEANCKVLRLTKELEDAQKALARKPQLQQSQTSAGPSGRNLIVSRMHQKADKREEGVDWQPRVQPSRDSNGRINGIVVRGPYMCSPDPGKGSAKAAKEESYATKKAGEHARLHTFTCASAAEPMLENDVRNRQYI